MSFVSKLIRLEQERQNSIINLIASENYTSKAVCEAVGSCFTNKYAEGYPDKRYYGGCQYADALETYCQAKWKAVFNAPTYHVNVQPHSGSSANMAVYAALLKPGDTILSMSLADGGHLSHGSPVSQSGKLYNIVHYGLGEDERIDYEDLRRKIEQFKPKLIIAGASAYSREIDFARIRIIIDDVCKKIEGQNAKYRAHGVFSVYCDSLDYHPLFMADIAHIAGLVAAGDHQSPFGIADVITTTTHKTLRGTRGGLIFCRPELAKKIDGAVFPGMQGGPLLHVIAGKAVTAEEACTDQFREYIHNVVMNSKAMANEFSNFGLRIVSGGTDNHMFLIDLSGTGLTGDAVQKKLEQHSIAVGTEQKTFTVNAGDSFMQAIFIPYGLTYSDSVNVVRNGGIGSTGA